jgi:hypothetical protein
MEFLNNLKFITVIALSLAMSAGLVDTHAASSQMITDYIAY